MATVSLATVSLAALLMPAAVAAAADAPTADELKQMYDAKQYKELIPKLSRALSLKGKEAADYDRYDLLSMKGEASLRLKAKSAAYDAFKEAAKATPDVPKSTVAAATALLVQASSGALTYTQKMGLGKGDKPDPIDIVEPDGRKSAFDALEHDLLAKAKPKVDAAKKGRNLAQILEAARGLGEVRTVEFAYDGGDGDVNAQLGDLGNAVCKLLDDDMDATVERLNADVKYVNAHIKDTSPNLQKSLLNLSHDAKAGDSEVSQVHDVAKQMPVVFGTVTDFKPTAERAAKLERQVTELRKNLRDSHVPGAD